MPELPEVETVVRALRPKITEQIIISVQLSEKSLRLPYPDKLVDLLTGKKITTIRRRAKYIIIELDSGENLVIHLGMSGNLLYSPAPLQNKHSHAFFNLSNQCCLTYHDPRRFGLITTINDNIDEHILFKHLGIEPLTQEFNADFLFTQLTKVREKRTQAIKTTIMDATLVVGVGNIYASESLFMVKISPLRQANSLSWEECEKLTLAIKEVLQSAIASGGSSLRDYTNPDGKSGYFQHKFMVYSRHDKPCYTCSTSIIKLQQAGRSTFFCPSCQG